MEFLSEYGLFLAKTVTMVVAIVFVMAAILNNAARGKGGDKKKGHIEVTFINDEIKELRDSIHEEITDESALKLEHKEEKKRVKAEKKAKKKAAGDEEERKRIFVLDFDGDPKASQVDGLRQCITAVLATARPDLDEVFVKLESPGGMVHAYGLAASQLHRFRKHNIPLTVCVDKMAASGGYMMACVANKIIAAPFAYIGSIGVVLQLPNVHRLLKDNKVDFEMITAGEYKRTLTTFGENTDKAREKVKQDVEEMHELFKDFIHENRPALDLEAVATGEVWNGVKAIKLGLVDELNTSDECLVQMCEQADVYAVSYQQKQKMSDKLSSMFEGAMKKGVLNGISEWFHKADKERFY